MSIEPESPTLTGIVYYSKATQAFDDESLRALAEQSSQANAKVGISGLLMYVDGYFMQYLEGENEPLSKLISKISADNRHTVLKQFSTSTLTARLFPAWNMRWLMDSELQQTRLREKLSARFADSSEVSEEVQAKQVWQLVDGLSALYQKMA